MENCNEQRAAGSKYPSSIPNTNNKFLILAEHIILILGSIFPRWYTKVNIYLSLKNARRGNYIYFAKLL